MKRYWLLMKVINLYLWQMIDSYYEKIRRGKQEKLFHEVIFQIGNKDDMNAKNEDGLLAKRILTEFMDEF